MATKTTIRGSSSTSYMAVGLEPKPRNFDRELASSTAVPLREVVPELRGRRQAIQVYDKMVRTDAVTSVSLRAAKVPVEGADFYIDPMGEDDVQRDIADFLTWNIFEGMSSTWSRSLVMILRKYQHGSSLFETVWIDRPWRAQRRMANNRTYTTLQKLAVRPVINIKDLVTDDQGGPQSILYNSIGKNNKITEVTIPIEKAIMFTMGDTDDLFGESVLRSAYQHWYYKTHLYKVDAIQKERHGIGVPKGTLPPGYSDDDKLYMNELLSNLRANEKSFATLPPGYDVGFMKPEGQMVDVLKSAHYHDVAILLNVMAEFMMLGLGSDGGGGRATSGAQLDIFYKSEWFLANSICDCFNRYLIPKLVLWNFETDTIPQMKVRNIGQARDLQQLSQAMANAANSEYITPDLPTEQFVRGLFDMPQKIGERPEISPSQMREQILLQGQFQNQAQQASTPGGGSQAQQPAQQPGTKPAVNPKKGQGNMGKSPTDA